MGSAQIVSTKGCARQHKSGARRTIKLCISATNSTGDYCTMAPAVPIGILLT
jgi:hypothetical protein